MDYYRQDAGDKDNVSYQIVLMNDEDKSWTRSDNSGITGTWSDIDGKIYMNFDDPTEDRWNSGVYKGFRIFQRKEAEPEYWECIKPQWYPTTKMFQKGASPPWG